MAKNDNPFFATHHKALSSFQSALGFKFKHLDLLYRALTHRSYVNEDAFSLGNNERLEFLGDAVLGLATASRLFTSLGDKAEGDLARIKSVVVSEDTLSRIAFGLELDKILLMGKGEELSGGRTKKAILADAMEAIIGAAYLDSGFEKANDLVLSLINPEIEKVLEDKHKKDYKTLLQEYAQKWHHIYPIYTIVKTSGPDHDKTYWTQCKILNTTYGPAVGKTKKESEQSAGHIAYEAILKAGGIEAEHLKNATHH